MYYFDWKPLSQSKCSGITLRLLVSSSRDIIIKTCDIQGLNIRLQNFNVTSWPQNPGRAKRLCLQHSRRPYGMTRQFESGFQDPTFRPGSLEETGVVPTL